MKCIDGLMMISGEVMEQVEKTDYMLLGIWGMDKLMEKEMIGDCKVDYLHRLQVKLISKFETNRIRLEPSISERLQLLNIENT